MVTRIKGDMRKSFSTQYVVGIWNALAVVMLVAGSYCVFKKERNGEIYRGGNVTKLGKGDVDLLNCFDKEPVC